MLSHYYNIPKDDDLYIQKANKTLDDAYACFIKEDFPFYKLGCDLKYEIDKNRDDIRGRDYYKSECMSGTPLYSYEVDKDAYINRELNKKLRKYENSPNYLEFKNLDDYCKRRFTNIEERFNCRKITNNVKTNFTSDYCKKRIFAEENSDLFSYNLVFKYKCLKERLRNVYMDPVLKT